ncbi:MAG: flagellar M-ring protein FliF [Proteobacteria bacterium]|nr:flagellar M-ring protein FliF [Pseudomonadota bacterium]
MNAMMQSFRGMGTSRVILLAVVGVVMMIAFGLVATRLNEPVMSPLYSNLSVEEGGEIIAELDKMGVPYVIGANGTQVSVPSSEVLKLRLSLAQKGMPSSGSIVGYEIFDKSEALGTSNFVQNVNMLRALEGELARTIASLSWVASARVHIVMPRKQIFNREKVDPSASVVLTLKDKKYRPSKEEASAISHLLSTAVPELKIGKITIVDNAGKLLAKGSQDSDDPNMAASDSDEFRVAYETRLKRTIEELIEQSVGVGRVRAEVSADIGFDRIVKNSETYDPDGQVVRSVQTSEEKENSSEGDSGTVSVKNNLPDATAGGGGGTSRNNVQRTDETTNYEISKTVTNHVSEVGQVKKVSVAVMVDGTYNFDTEQGKNIYTPRSDEELEKMRALVRSAVGFDEKRGDKVEIINMPFSREGDDFKDEEKPFDWLKRDLQNILKTLVIGIVAIMVIMMVIRPLVNRAFEVAPPEPEIGAALGLNPNLGAATGGPGAPEISLESDDGIDLQSIQNRSKGSALKKVNDVAQSNPEETLQVIRDWMTQKA